MEKLRTLATAIYSELLLMSVNWQQFLAFCGVIVVLHTFFMKVVVTPAIVKAIDNAVKPLAKKVQNVKERVIVLETEAGVKHNHDDDEEDEA